ncbi:MAG: hypothetical protein BWY76_02975 [bacterium ADurb.Bin429]|nr:MAG: hypothetical protein BWY76_02975 [bacterium ADurb.Bin429]
MVPARFCFADRHFAENIEGECHAAGAKAADDGDGLHDIRAGDEVPRHAGNLRPRQRCEHRSGNAIRGRRAQPSRADCLQQREPHPLGAKVLNQMIEQRIVIRQHGQHVHKMEELHLEALIAHCPFHQAHVYVMPGQPARGARRGLE